MADPKKVFDSPDVQPVALYVKDTVADIHAKALLAPTLNPGLAIPEHDTILLSYTSGDLTQVDYTLSTVTQATVTLSYTSGDLTSVVKS